MTDGSWTRPARKLAEELGITPRIGHVMRASRSTLEICIKAGTTVLFYPTWWNGFDVELKVIPA